MQRYVDHEKDIVYSISAETRIPSSLCTCPQMTMKAPWVLIWGYKQNVADEIKSAESVNIEDLLCVHLYIHISGKFSDILKPNYRIRLMMPPYTAPWGLNEIIQVEHLQNTSMLPETCRRRLIALSYLASFLFVRQLIFPPYPPWWGSLTFNLARTFSFCITMVLENH